LAQTRKNGYPAVSFLYQLGVVMKKFLFLVVAVGALFYYKPGPIAGLFKSGAFDSKGNPQVLVFTARQCNGACEKAVQELTERKIEFKEVKLDGNDENMERYKKLGGNGVIPLLVAGSNSVQGFDHGKYTSLLAQTYGEKALTPMERVYFGRHFKADGTPTVYMYGATWCGYCKVLRAEMEKRKIDFAEVDVDTIADRAEMESAMDLAFLPVTYVGYNRFVGSNNIEEVIAAMKSAEKRKM
jgi:glutaredoxin